MFVFLTCVAFIAYAKEFDNVVSVLRRRTQTETNKIDVEEVASRIRECAVIVDAVHDNFGDDHDHEDVHYCDCDNEDKNESAKVNTTDEPVTKPGNQTKLGEGNGFHDPIVLNVGGTRFAVGLSTLRSVDGSFLEKMFREGAETTASPDGTYFIDRNPGTFPIILDYLRNNVLLIDNDDYLLQWQVYHEAEYFGLPEVSLQATPYAHIGLLYSEFEFLNQQLKFKSKKLGEILFQASKNNFEVSSFHNKCDGKGPTVVIVETSTGTKFGGYSDKSWKSTLHGAGTYITSSNSFLFQLRPSMNRYDLVSDGYKHAIYSSSSRGPVFGVGHDLNIVSGCENTDSCYTNQNTYNMPSAYALNNGKHKFKLKDYVVVKALSL